MSQNKLKTLCAKAALDYILPKLHGRTILGIGTGSTTNLFIELMAQKKIRFYSLSLQSQKEYRLKNVLMMS